MLGSAVVARSRGGRPVLGADLGRGRRTGRWLLIHGVTASAELVAGRAGAGGHGTAGRRGGPARARTTGHWTGRSTGSGDGRGPRAASRGAGPRVTSRSSRTAGARWSSTCLPAVGLRPSRLVLLDPPTISLEQIVHEVGRPRADVPASPEAALRRALAATTRTGPTVTSTRGELAARRSTLRRRAGLLFDNGDWDSGLAELAGSGGGRPRRPCRPRRAGDGRPHAGRGRGDLRRDATAPTTSSRSSGRRTRHSRRTRTS